MKSGPMRNCEKCQHFRVDPLKKHAHCERGQKLHFTFPKLPGFQHPDTWGYRKRCHLFQKWETASNASGPAAARTTNESESE